VASFLPFLHSAWLTFSFGPQVAAHLSFLKKIDLLNAVVDSTFCVQTLTTLPLSFPPCPPFNSTPFSSRYKMYNRPTPFPSLSPQTPIGCSEEVRISLPLPPFSHENHFPFFLILEITSVSRAYMFLFLWFSPGAFAAIRFPDTQRPSRKDGPHSTTPSPPHQMMLKLNLTFNLYYSNYEVLRSLHFEVQFFDLLFYFSLDAGGPCWSCSYVGLSRPLSSKAQEPKLIR